MPINPENLPKHELIGLECEVVESEDEGQIGISGEVLDETQNMLRIEDKQVEKETSVFRFTLPSGEKVRVDGELINKRPEERAGMSLPDDWEYVE
jgi:ribonuclease P protein subunit POP4